ncbi:hypothetical protein [Spiroplasma endosymbiont of 'Nebria riversi']|uniref:hypothetical protein n=1 Tax=Spiroplasma endosymbiont of 'Nebria riversi' TaxID=2792084 RepID=UPI001C050910|nr:hypothetical protein [Spiroplasma endosymbiont of 'Nebria riversi']
MKKLLSLLSISTLIASLPAPLRANAPLTRFKRDVNTLTSNSNNDYLPPTKIDMSYFGDVDNVSSIMIDKQNNVYFGADKGAFFLKWGSTRLTKINGINSRVYSVAIDSNNNVYFGADKGVFFKKNGEVNAKKIDKINDDIKSIFIDKQDNVYFGVSNGAYKLSADSNTKTKINGITEHVSSIMIDKQDNVYFGSDYGAYVLKRGSKTATPIKGSSDNISSIMIDKQDNVYFGSDYGAYVLKQGSTGLTKINGIFPWINSVSVDSKDNVYFGTYEGVFVLKQGSKTATPIKGSSKHVSSIAIDNNNNVYFGGDNRLNYITTILDWVKQQSRFNLVDNNKPKTWIRPDLIAVDGELNIEITNPTIDKVLFDNVQQIQTNKQWNINVKPEISTKDHNLQVFFTLNGKQYTSEIMVSMQAKINPPKPIVKENLDKVIKFSDDNNLGNMLDNNNKTIISAISQKNSLQVDFSQIEFDKKDNHSTILTAKPDSKSYQGSVVVKYNIVLATIVDLKIDLQPTVQTTQVVKDYVGQIDTDTITNPVNIFYYANSESKITMLKPTPNSVINGVVYGCDEQWNKTSQHNSIDSTNGVVLDGSQLARSNGKYVVELSDNLGHTNNLYLQISSKQAIPKYFDTDNGKQFEIWAKANGRDDICGYSVRQLNKLFEESKNWHHQASDSQLADSLAKWFKTNGKLAAEEALTKEQVIAQLQTQMQKTITIDKVDTSNYDFKKVSFELNQNEIKPNEKVNIAVKYGSEKSDNFTLQIENNKPSNNNKSGLTGWNIIGVIIGALSGLLLLGWLFKKFVVTPFILEPIRKKKVEAFQNQTEKDIVQMKADEKEEQEKNK